MLSTLSVSLSLSRVCADSEALSFCGRLSYRWNFRIY
ncbi:hypothetical protein CIPAW_09G085300 [Carya illinoinensis]|uniref:Uncharacterized protein n=1 Tax=Carya illinoinensis TaxID=32201 RepID=A0A8T1PAC8_CARIL|nr:hypothetical protein CIPAW_09G085300 [Carya illinoinensis]